MTWVDVLPESLPGPMRMRVRGRSMWPVLHSGDKVLVIPVTVSGLLPGDWVMLRSAQGTVLHRYLGKQRGYVLTKGDSHIAFDPPWSPEAVLGRVEEAERAGRCFYRRTAPRLCWERILALAHYIVGYGGIMLHRSKIVRSLKAWLGILLFTLLVVPSLLAAPSAPTAVTLTDFYVEETETKLIIHWETASEVGNLGFSLFRSEEPTVTYQKLTYLPSTDKGAGALYQYEDTDITPGITYYYKLQDTPADNSSKTTFGPISAGIDAEPTPANTVPATTTTSPTPLPTAQTSSPSPEPYVNFWSDVTELEAGKCATLQWQTDSVRAVYLNGEGVVGTGAKAFCPCETQTYILRVLYQDESYEDFAVTVSVTGICQDPVVTSTSLPVPSLTPSSTIVPVLTPTVTPARVTTLPAAVTPSPVPTKILATRALAIPSPTNLPPQFLSEVESVSPEVVLPTLPAVQGERVKAGTFPVLPLVLLVGLVGIIFVGVGIWIWNRQR